MPHGWPDYVAFESPVTVPQGGTGAGIWTPGALLLGNGTNTLQEGVGFGEGARVTNSADITIPNNAWTMLTFDTERYDNGGLHSPTVNPGRLTAQHAGLYLIVGAVRWSGLSSAGTRIIGIDWSAAGYPVIVEQQPVAGTTPRMHISTLWRLNTGEYVDLQVFQDSGGDLAVLTTGFESPMLAMQWLSP